MTTTEQKITILRTKLARAAEMIDVYEASRGLAETDHQFTAADMRVDNWYRTYNSYLYQLDSLGAAN